MRILLVIAAALIAVTAASLPNRELRVAAGKGGDLSKQLRSTDILRGNALPVNTSERHLLLAVQVAFPNNCHHILRGNALPVKKSERHLLLANPVLKNIAPLTKLSANLTHLAANLNRNPPQKTCQFPRLALGKTNRDLRITSELIRQGGTQDKLRTDSRLFEI
ncbi:hypothetical protein AeRB84_007111 [Aphanomyces euteiches]|nr:hypothetical protein AeRB84_007111 [Aphanomyces euteiches]